MSTPKTSFENFVKRAITAARKKMGEKSAPICIDGIEEFYKHNDFAGAVDHLVNEHYYWNIGEPEDYQ